MRSLSRKTTNVAGANLQGVRVYLLGVRDEKQDLRTFWHERTFESRLHSQGPLGIPRTSRTRAVAEVVTNFCTVRVFFPVLYQITFRVDQYIAVSIYSTKPCADFLLSCGSFPLSNTCRHLHSIIYEIRNTRRAGEFPIDT